METVSKSGAPNLGVMEDGKAPSAAVGNFQCKIVHMGKLVTYIVLIKEK